MAGPLGVTHLLLFSKSDTGNTNLRIALTPRGPTLHFKVENYSLCKDVEKALKRPRGGGQDHRTPPLLVMNNFNLSDTDETSKVPKRLESLTTTVFQSLFPPINPQITPLSSIRRVMLLNRDPPSKQNTSDDSYNLSLRHYAITTKKADVPKRIRRLDPKEVRSMDKKGAAVPNLGKLEDAADYLLDPSAAGYTSASETEQDTDAEVEVAESSAKKILGKRGAQRTKSSGWTKPNSASRVERRAVKLVELGPRMKLKLIKVEAGVCEGKVMWHDFIKKSDKEVKELEKSWDQRRKEKEARKKQQKENIEKKRQDKAKRKGKEEEEGETENDDDDDTSMDDEWLSDDDEGEDDDEQDEEDDGSMEE